MLITGLTGQPVIKTEFVTTPIVGYTADTFFVKDVITLNFGQFVNQQLFGMMQLATAVPFPTPRADVPSNYVGLTNQQLWDLYGVALGGAIAPSNPVTASNIIGVVAPKV